MKEEKSFMVKFIVKEGNIATKVETNNIPPQECIGLLEIAKQQLLKSLEEKRKEVFRSSKNE
jgi:hypothetical protein